MICSSWPVPRVATDQRLGLAAGEQRRAVGARQDADFGADRADGLAVAAVDALAGLHDVAAHDVALEVLEQLADQVGLGLVIAADRDLGLLLHLVDLVGAGLLGLLGIGAAQIVGRTLCSSAHDRLLLRAVFGQRPRLLGALLGQVDDGVDDVLELGAPNMTAPSMTSSDSSLASDSTISTPSAVPATTRSSCEFGSWSSGRVQHVLRRRCSRRARRRSGP